MGILKSVFKLPKLTKLHDAYIDLETVISQGCSTGWNELLVLLHNGKLEVRWCILEVRV